VKGKAGEEVVLELDFKWGARRRLSFRLLPCCTTPGSLVAPPLLPPCLLLVHLCCPQRWGCSHRPPPRLSSLLLSARREAAVASWVPAAALPLSPEPAAGGASLRSGDRSLSLTCSGASPWPAAVADVCGCLVPGGNPSIILGIKTFTGISLPVQVKDLQVFALVRIAFTKFRGDAFPCFGGVLVSLSQRVGPLHPASFGPCLT
jgi:hypothetical protein